MAQVATNNWIADCKRLKVNAPVVSRKTEIGAGPSNWTMTYVMPISSFRAMGETFWGYSMPSSVFNADMHARTHAHPSTSKSLADHKLEIYQRIICELIATFEVDDETISTAIAPASRRGNQHTPASRTAESRIGRGSKHDRKAPDRPAA